MRDGDAVPLGEIFRRQRRTEIGIAFADDGDDALAKGIAKPPVARWSALARNEPRRTFVAQSREQFEHLAARQAERRHGIFPRCAYTISVIYNPDNKHYVKLMHCFTVEDQRTLLDAPALEP